MSLYQNDDGGGAGRGGGSTEDGWQSIPKVLRISLIVLLPSYILWAITPRRSFLSILSGLALFGSLAALFFWGMALVLKVFLLPIVRKEQIVDQWQVLIEEGQDHAAEIVEGTKGLIVESKAPNVSMEEREVAPGFVRGARGERRPFLVISNSTNANLKLYEMYVSAREYGNNLQVSWYLIKRPGLKDIILKLGMIVPLVNVVVLPIYALVRMASEGGSLNLDFFDLQDLSAYVTNAHHCVLDSVDQLLLDLSQDPSDIERKSRGFLGVS